MNRILLILCLVAASAARAADPSESGRVLIDQFNCVACHAASESQAKWLSPKMAPRLADVGGRASPEWLMRYLNTPHEIMPGTTMPDVLQSLPDNDRAKAAESLTHYLLSEKATGFNRVMPDRAAVARGESLYHRVGCVACHSPQRGTELPSVPLPQMAEKWAFDGLRRFLLDPLASRPSGRMPGMRLTEVEASDLAHYLLRETRVPAAVELAAYRGEIRSLGDIDTAELTRTGPADGIAVDPAMRDRGNALRFTTWLRVDRAGDYTFYFSAAGASRLSVDGKWVAGQDSWEREKVDVKVKLHLDAGLSPLLVDYVHRGSKRPAMKLEWEGPGVAREMLPASRLRSEREMAREPAALVVDQDKAAEGRSLYQKLNCAACHDPKTPSKIAPALAALNETRGCLAETVPANVPDFHIDSAQRQALRAATQSLNRADLPAPSPRQQVAHTMATLNCAACHARDGTGGVTGARNRFFTSSAEDLGDEGRIPPNLDGVGDRLLPAWLDKVLTQGGSVRPYFDTRMPQFGRENVGHLTELLVAIDRKPQTLVVSGDDPTIQKEAGRKIVGTDGLSCIVCHRFNRQPAQTMQVIDLTTATERLNEDWFRRYLLDPNRFHPGTRMPALWPDGKSQLPTLLGGDTDRQLAAIWTYLADGGRAKFPEGLSRENVELIVGGEAVVYRGKLWEAGFRAVATGYPGQLNAAFDAEEMRLALLWRGRFLNAGPHWQVQGMGQIRPLGTDVVVFPHGSALAILADANAPWPSEASKVLGVKFGGYQLDALQRPTLLYSLGNTGVEDLLTPSEGNGKPAMRRTITFTGPPADGLHFRVATGKLVSKGANSWRLNEAITLSIQGAGKPFTRGTGDQQELLVPIRFEKKTCQLEVEYAW